MRPQMRLKRGLAASRNPQPATRHPAIRRNAAKKAPPHAMNRVRKAPSVV